MKLYICETCGNIIEKVNDSGVPVVCCGKPMKELIAGTVDAAREGAFQLCKDKNQKMIEFVLKNEGYNPTQKVEADITTDINISIEE